MNSWQLAQQWPFPRHNVFEKELRAAAADWFKARGYATRSRMPYCLKAWSEWTDNIILDEVAAYIENCRTACKLNGEPFPLHKYVHHGLSSQAMAFNLIGPLITRDDMGPLLTLLKQQNIHVPGDVVSACFEYEEREVFNEDRGQPTSIDVVLKNREQVPVVFIEVKLAEKGFGGCSVFANGDCNGRSPLSGNNTCYLQFIDRWYWHLMEKYGFSQMLEDERQCIFVAHYQFFREVLFSLEKGGIFILLSDERSPVFHCSADGAGRGLMPFLLEFVPNDLKDRIASVSIQRFLTILKQSEKHRDWVDPFERKYGLARPAGS